MSKHSEEVARHWGAPVPGHLKHGVNTYAAKVYGCDCSACLPSGKRRPAKGQGASATQRSRKLRQSKRGRPVPPHVRHGIYAYATYGCRCDPCSAAKAEEKERHELRQRETWHGHWHKGPDTTIVHWPPRDLEGPWLCPTCGEFKVIPS